MNIKISSYWLIWDDCTDAMAFFHALQLTCRLNQPCAWIQQLISAWINGQPIINLRSTTPAWLLVESTVWLNQTNQQLITAWINYRPEINRYSLIAAWINCLVESTRTAVDFRLNDQLEINTFGWFNPIETTVQTFPTLGSGDVPVIMDTYRFLESLLWACMVVFQRNWG
jgi:hypothetical protein